MLPKQSIALAAFSYNIEWEAELLPQASHTTVRTVPYTAIPVRQASVLPATSFRSNLTVDTLAVRLTVHSVGPVRDFHHQVSAPCRAHQKKGGLNKPPS